MGDGDSSRPEPAVGAPVPIKPRSDRENLAKLDRLRPIHEDLKGQKIRSESELQRAIRDLEEARRAAEEEVGTSDLDQIRGMVEERWAANTRDVDDFEAKVNAVQAAIPAKA